MEYEILLNGSQALEFKKLDINPPFPVAHVTSIIPRATAHIVLPKAGNKAPKI